MVLPVARGFTLTNSQIITLVKAIQYSDRMLDCKVESRDKKSELERHS